MHRIFAEGGLTSTGGKVGKLISKWGKFHTKKLCRTKGMETKGKKDKRERPGLLCFPSVARDMVAFEKEKNESDFPL